VDECAGVDALITNRVWTKLGFAPETTLHDVRYGEDFQLDGKKEFIWVYEISGAVPPAHLPGGYAGASSERQPPMFFKKGGGTIKGVCKAGEIVWSRVFVDNGKLKVDIGRGRAVELPKEETDRLWKITNPEWPMMLAITYGVSRNQFMARTIEPHPVATHGCRKRQHGAGHEGRHVRGWGWKSPSAEPTTACNSSLLEKGQIAFSARAF
jgi:hypothetical protein